MGEFYTAGHRRLQDRFGTRRLADRVAEVASSDRFNDHHRAIVAKAPFFWLATADADWWPDVSYKGGVRGFARVDDDHTLLFPAYDGNGMYRSLGNINENPRVGLLFIDFEKPGRLRVKGTAAIVDDAAVVETFERAELVVAVTADRIFYNCPRYVHKMTIEQVSEFAPCEGHVPPEPEWKQAEVFRPYVPNR